MIEHTCLLSEVQLLHRNISSDFVAKQIYGLIMDNLNYEPKMIVRYNEPFFVLVPVLGHFSVVFR